jgi:hypothetical protein
MGFGSSEERLDRLLKEAFPRVEVSADFTLRLWRKLMKPARPPWMLPIPVYGLAAAVGIVTGVWTWAYGLPGATSGPMAFTSRPTARLDLLGNAPTATLAASVLKNVDR